MTLRRRKWTGLVPRRVTDKGANGRARSVIYSQPCEHVTDVNGRRVVTTGWSYQFSVHTHCWLVLAMGVQLGAIDIYYIPNP